MGRTTFWAIMGYIFGDYELHFGQFWATFCTILRYVLGDLCYILAGFGLRFGQFWDTF
jgi:hypothetical protein